LFNTTPVAGATLSAVDLATDKSLPLLAAGGQNLIAAGGQNYALSQSSAPQTDANGRFDMALPPLEPGQLVILRATSGSQIFLAMFDHRGRAVGQASAGQEPVGVSSYLVQQARGLSVALRLTVASTALVNAFEGVFRLQLRRPASEISSAIERLVARVQEIGKDLEQKLAANPEKATALMQALGAGGEVASLESFRSVLGELGVLESLREAVKEEIQALREVALQNGNDQVPLAIEDFPLEEVSISSTGAITIGSGATAVTVGVTVQPTTPTTPVSGGGGGRGGGGSSSGSSNTGGSTTTTQTGGNASIPEVRPANATISGTVRYWDGTSFAPRNSVTVKLYRAAAPGTSTTDGTTVQLVPPSFSNSVSLEVDEDDTDINGFYSFPNLPAGGYFVVVDGSEPRYVSFANGGVAGVDLLAPAPPVGG
jgi:hypothetical protein